ncbi:hypothetical protein AB6864_21440 [Serratia proteamaculans]|uniref:MrpH family fimbial adhesin n=1 Tax=Serratia proteamaculans TaxID=28151 RepID=UPI0021837962|nr:hypothetical protein [Serratia proteamaculans]CAI2468221.1 Uncharacterised protein [Serratia proteamaculans]
MKLLRTPKMVQAFLLGGLCLVTLLVSGFGVLPANAAAYVSVDRSWRTPSGYPSFMNWNGTGQWEWPSENGNVSVCSLRKCRVLICVRRIDPSKRIPLTLCDVKTATILSGMTATQAQQEWVSKHGTSGSWQAGPSGLAGAYDQNCVGFVIENDIGIFGGAIPIIGASCGKVPPPDLVCTTSGKVTIDYGTLDSSKLNGATASTTLSITCNQAATATIQLNDSVIDLGRKGDLTAAISIGGKDLATGSDIAVKDGTVTATITSTLKAKGTPAAGAFEGSGVLIIGYQ